MKSINFRFNWKDPGIIHPQGQTYPWVVLVVVTLMLILSMFAVVMTAVGDPVLQGALSLSKSTLLWVNVAYLLAVVLTVPLSQLFARKKGYKLALFTGAVLYFIGMLGSSISSDTVPLMLFRGITGIGGGLYTPVSMAFIGRAFYHHQLPLALALYSAVGYGFGLVIAFILGGFVAQHTTWHWLFLVSAIVAAVGCVMIALFLQETEKESIGPFDTGGYASYALMMCSYIVIISSGKAPWNTLGWTSDFMKICYTTFLVGMVSFILFEIRGKNPIFNIKLFKIRLFLFGSLLLFLVGAIYFATAQTLPAIFQEYMGYSKIKSGLYMIPHAACLGLSSAICGIVSRKVGIRIPLVIGCLILVLSCYIQNFLSIYSDHKFIIFLLIFRGVGVGMSVGPVTALALIRISKEDMANAAMTATLFRQIGATSATSLIAISKVMRGDFHQARFLEQMGDRSPEYTQVIERLTMHNTSMLGESLIEAKKHAHGQLFDIVHRQAYLNGINDGYLILGGITLLITLTIGFFMVRARFIARLKNKRKATSQQAPKIN